MIFGLGGGGGLIPALLVGLELVLEVEDEELEGGGAGRGLYPLPPFR